MNSLGIRDEARDLARQGHDAAAIRAALREKFNPSSVDSAIVALREQGILPPRSYRRPDLLHITLSAEIGRRLTQMSERAGLPRSRLAKIFIERALK